jgi:4'-phosphopantetheinyl transferase
MLASIARRPSPAFALDRGIVHVWHCDLDVLQSYAGRQVGVLDEGERARALRLKRPQDRRKFIAAHAAARKLIGLYLRRSPETLRFGRAANGKPQVIRLADDIDLRFNASRTKGQAIFAFAFGREVGIDIETITDQPHWSEAHSAALSLNERLLLNTLPTEDERLRAFIALWVRKEALLKARGDGMAATLSEIDVTRGFLRDTAQREWRVEDLDWETGWAAAIAAEGSGWMLGPVRSCTALNMHSASSDFG